MWYKTEYDHEPSETDDTSSKKYVYVRKDITEIEKEDGKAWSCKEQKVKKEDWELYQSILTNTSDISDVQDALIELASLIGE